MLPTKPDPHRSRSICLWLPLDLVAALEQYARHGKALNRSRAAIVLLRQALQHEEQNGFDSLRSR